MGPNHRISSTYFDSPNQVNVRSNPKATDCRTRNPYERKSSWHMRSSSSDTGPNQEVIFDGIRIRVSHPKAWRNTGSEVCDLTRHPSESRQLTADVLWANTSFKVSIHSYKMHQSSSKSFLVSTSTQFEVSGSVGICALLRSYTPRETRLTVTPEDVSFTNACLLIAGDNFHYNWFSLFILRFPIDLSWDIARDPNGHRIYINLRTGNSQRLHPNLPSFRKLLAVIQTEERLWDIKHHLNRPCMLFESAQASMWCHQCGVLSCTPCIQSRHEVSGKGHVVSPLPGCISTAISCHPTNGGVCNKERYFGYPQMECGCEWLWFEKTELTIEWLAYMSENCSSPDVTTSGYFFNMLTGQVGLGDFENQRIALMKKHVAVILIQKLVRSFLVKCRLKRQQSAAITIQSNARRFIARKRFLSQWVLATTGWRREMMMNKFKRKVIRSVCRIQAGIRGWIVRRKLRIIRNSVKQIEAVWLGILCRKRLEICWRNAIDIQRVFRGYRDRAKMQIHANACILIQSFVRGILAKRRYKTILQSCIRIQSRMRGILVRRRIVDQKIAAVKIQAVWRRYAAMVKFRQRLVCSLISLRSTLNQLIMSKLSSVSATRIQSQYRRHLVRKFFVCLKNDRMVNHEQINCGLSVFMLALCSMRSRKHPWADFLFDHEKFLFKLLEKVEDTQRLYTVMEWVVPGSGRWVTQSASHWLVKSLGERVNFDRNILLSLGENDVIPNIISQSVLLNARHIMGDSKIDLNTNLAIVGFGSNHAENLIKRVVKDLDDIECPIAEWSRSLWRSTCASLVMNVQTFLSEGGRRERFRVKKRLRKETSVVELFMIVRSVLKHARTPQSPSPFPSMDPDRHFVLGVILVHNILRKSLESQNQNHGARCIQVFYRYWTRRRLTRRYKPQVTLIQRVWRGYRERKTWMLKDIAMRVIQRNLKVLITMRQNKRLIAGIVCIQSVTRGWIQRRWMKRLRLSAILIQKIFRGHLVRLVLGTREKRELRGKCIGKIRKDPENKQTIEAEYYEKMTSDLKEGIARKWSTVSMRSRFVSDVSCDWNWLKSPLLSRRVEVCYNQATKLSIPVGNSIKLIERLDGLMRRQHEICIQGYREYFARLQRVMNTKKVSRGHLVEFESFVRCVSVYRYLPNVEVPRLREMYFLVFGFVFGISGIGLTAITDGVKWIHRNDHYHVLTLLNECIDHVIRFSRLPEKLATELIMKCIEMMLGDLKLMNLLKDVLRHVVMSATRPSGKAPLLDLLGLTRMNRQQVECASVLVTTLAKSRRQSVGIDWVLKSLGSILALCPQSDVFRGCVFGLVIRAIRGVGLVHKNSKGIEMSWTHVSRLDLFGDRTIAAAVLKIQSVWRGHNVRKYRPQIKDILTSVTRKTNKRTFVKVKMSQAVIEPTAEHFACARLYFLWSFLCYQRDVSFKIFARMIDIYSIVYERFTKLVMTDPKCFATMVSTSERIRQHRIDRKRGYEKPIRVKRMSSLSPVREPTVHKPSNEYLAQYKRLMEGDDSLFHDVVGEIEVVWNTTLVESDSVPLVWTPIRTSRFTFAREKLLGDEKLRKKFNRLERNRDIHACFMMLMEAELRPYEIELVYNVGMGYVAQCVLDGKEQLAFSLIHEMLKSVSTKLGIDTSIDTQHKLLIEAMVFETAMGYAYAFPNSVIASEVTQWFEAASKTYCGLHVARFMRCCNRYACFLNRTQQHQDAIKVLTRACEQRGYRGNMHLITQLNLAASMYNSGDHEKAKDEWKGFESIVTSQRTLRRAIRDIC